MRAPETTSCLARRRERYKRLDDNIFTVEEYVGELLERPLYIVPRDEKGSLEIFPASCQK